MSMGKRLTVAERDRVLELRAAEPELTLDRRERRWSVRGASRARDVTPREPSTAPSSRPGTAAAQPHAMDRERAAARLAECEAAYRRAQRGTCPVRYRAAWAALVEAERAVVLLLQVIETTW